MDLEVWVSGNRVRTSFYRKPCAPNRVIQSRSALSMRTKRDTLFNEGIRRLSAMDGETLAQEMVPVMAEFNWAMIRAGYGPLLRQDTLAGAVKRDKELRESPEGRYRDRAAILKAKEENNLKFPNTWFLRGGNTAVVKVQPTPGAVLAKEVRRRIGSLKAPDGGGTLVIEAAGRSVLAGLKCPDPGVEGGCPYMRECLVDSKYNCGGTRTIYKLDCNLCEASYLGTTGHSAHKRCLEHHDALIQGNDAYAMTKHYLQDHPQWNNSSGQKPFTMSIVKGPNLKGNLQRYLGEALQIRESTKRGDKVLNARGEWGRACLKRLAIVED